jgi:hypothetical protein
MCRRAGMTGQDRGAHPDRSPTLALSEERVMLGVPGRVPEREREGSHGWHLFQRDICQSKSRTPPHARCDDHGRDAMLGGEPVPSSEGLPQEWPSSLRSLRAQDGDKAARDDGYVTEKLSHRLCHSIRPHARRAASGSVGAKREKNRAGGVRRLMAIAGKPPRSRLPLAW